MKKVLNIVILLLVISIKNTYAMNLKPYGDSELITGEETSVYITIEKNIDDDDISAIEGKLYYDDKVFELISFENLMTGWTEFAEIKNNSIFAYGNLKFDNLINTMTKEMLEIKFKVKNNSPFGNTYIKILNPSATNENGYYVNIEGGEHLIKILSNENTLSSINVDGTNITLTKDIFEYDIEVDKSSIIIDAIPKDNTASVIGDLGLKNLEYGNNIFKIKVISESGKEQIYTLNIIRPDNRSTINKLSDLKLSSGNITFDKDINNYNIFVDNNVSELKIEADLLDKKSSFVENYGPRSIHLNIGENVVLIKVKAENGSINTYILNITKEKNITTTTKKPTTTSSTTTTTTSNTTTSTTTTTTTTKPTTSTTTTQKPTNSSAKTTTTTTTTRQSTTKTAETTATTKKTTEKKEDTSTTKNTNDNNYIKEILINDTNLIFNKKEYEHRFNVKYDVTKAEIKIKPEDENATYNILGDENLSVGENTYIVNITATDGTVREYKIIITRHEEEVTLSNNSKLKKIEVDGYKLEFDKNKYDYNIKIKNEKELNINYILEDDNSEVNIIGNEKLKSNSIIRITVKAQDNTYTEYRIKVEKEPINPIILIISIISFGFLILLIKFILKHKKILTNKNEIVDIEM